jgi:hypothetical protein
MFGGLAFGQYWTEEAAVAAAVAIAPDGGLERRKPEEPDIWPQPWMAPHVPPEQPEPDFTGTTATPTFAPEPVAAEPFAPPAEAVEALANPLYEVSITDPRIAQEIAALRESLQRELEDEEILFLMGFFD